MKRKLIAVVILCLLLTGGCTSVTVMESILSDDTVTTHQKTVSSNTAVLSTTPSAAAVATPTTEPFILYEEDLLTGETWYIDGYTGETVTRPPGLNTTRLTTARSRKALTRPAHPVITDTFEGTPHPRATMTPEKASYRPDETVCFQILLVRKEGDEGLSDFIVTQPGELWEADGDQWVKKFPMFEEEQERWDWPAWKWGLAILEEYDSATSKTEIPLFEYYDIGYGKRYKVVYYVRDRTDQKDYILTAEFSTVSQ